MWDLFANSKIIVNSEVIIESVNSVYTGDILSIYSISQLLFASLTNFRNDTESLHEILSIPRFRIENFGMILRKDFSEFIERICGSSANLSDSGLPGFLD